MKTDIGHHIGSRSVRILAIVVCTSLGACSWIPKGESGLDVGIRDRGVASWYGERFHGRQAANGELFDMSALTAAHRTLPLGSIVRVVNLRNGKQVRVRITDRGPYVKGRMLDLSRAAADRLGMVEGGLSVVQLEVVGDHRPEFMVRSEDSSPVSARLLALRPLGAPEMATGSYPFLDRANHAMMPLQRLAPNDMLLQRRWRWAPSILETGPTNLASAGLMLA